MRLMKIMNRFIENREKKKSGLRYWGEGVATLDINPEQN